MFCSQCGADLVDGVCPNCAAENAQVTSEPEYVELEPKKKKNLALAIVCLATGIFSLICNATSFGFGCGIGIPAAIASLITGQIFKKQYGEPNSMSKAGTVCAIIAIAAPVAAAIAGVLLYVCYLVFAFAIGLLAVLLGGM